MHATAFLKEPEKHLTGPIVVVYGTQRYLKHAAIEAISVRVLGSDGPGATRFDGKSADIKTVFDELLTISMWGDRRLVVVEDADEFVTAHRAALEKYLDKPARKSVLILAVKSWPKNTRLAKATAKVGLDLECSDLTGTALNRWLTDEVRRAHCKTLSPDAAALMVQLAGLDLGLLEQELAKLAAYVGEHSKIEAADVQTLVGGWRAETTWTMTAAVRDGNLSLALASLDKLLVAGEASQKITGGIGFVYRKLAHATRLAQQGAPLNAALQQSGVFPREIDSSARYLRRIGRPRAEMIIDHLLNADLDLKGRSRIPERTQLEKLLVLLSGAI